MVTDFHPEKTEVYGDKGFQVVGTATLQRFITADTPTKLIDFLEEMSGLFDILPGGLWPSPSQSDFRKAAEDARQLLVDALEMLRLSKVEDEVLPGAEQLEALGIKATLLPKDVAEFHRSSDRLVMKVIEGFELADQEEIGRFIRDSGYHALDGAERLVEVHYIYDVEGSYYADVLDRLVAADRANADARGVAAHFDGGYLIFDDDGNPQVADNEYHDYRLYGSFGVFPDTPHGIRHALQNIADGLFNLHLLDVRTISAHGGQEGRVIATGLASLWWCALDAMRIGRLGACEVCGKPYVANNERGKKRKYCSEACKQWHKKHPGEKRRPIERVKDKEWLSQSGSSGLS